MPLTTLDDQKTRPVFLTNRDGGDAQAFCARDFARMGWDHGYLTDPPSFHPLTSLEREYTRSLTFLPASCPEASIHFGYSFAYRDRKQLGALIDIPFKIGDETDEARAQQAAVDLDQKLVVYGPLQIFRIDGTDRVTLRVMIPPGDLIRDVGVPDEWPARFLRLLDKGIPLGSERLEETLPVPIIGEAPGENEVGP